MDWIDLAQEGNRWQALVNVKNVGNFMTSCGSVTFSRRIPLHGDSYYPDTLVLCGLDGYMALTPTTSKMQTFSAAITSCPHRRDRLCSIVKLKNCPNYHS
jgi:hypothetical protein